MLVCCQSASKAILQPEREKHTTVALEIYKRGVLGHYKIAFHGRAPSPLPPPPPTHTHTFYWMVVTVFRNWNNLFLYNDYFYRCLHPNLTWPVVSGWTLFVLLIEGLMSSHRGAFEKHQGRQLGTVGLRKRTGPAADPGMTSP